MYVTVYYSKCPDCGSKWSTKLSQGEVIRIGRETFTCKCPKDWPTGQIEWAHLDPRRRKKYFFSSAEIGVLSICAGIPAVFGFFIEGNSLRAAGIGAAWGLAFGLSFAAFLWSIKMIIVRLSLHRLPHAAVDVHGGWPWNW